jgi:hypothetical protein
MKEKDLCEEDEGVDERLLEKAPFLWWCYKTQKWCTLYKAQYGLIVTIIIA